MWRGGTSGRPSDRSIGWRSLPRIRLCDIGREHPDIIDARITHIAQMPNVQAEEEIRNSGPTADFMPATEFNKFRYQIDIDGNTNSWPGLFQKLLTGSPVLKVASPGNYRQWYYDRLAPWVNYVPVATDMSDLVEKIEWLASHDDAVARAIGQQGKALAESLDYDGEVRRSIPIIAAAVRHFSGRPETELRFANGGQAAAEYLVDGWTAAENGLPWAIGDVSHIDLPRPIAACDFVLELDVRPHVHPQLRPSQRLTVCVNGEAMHSVSLGTPSTVTCLVPRRLLEARDRMRITLLHPNGVALTAYQRAGDASPAAIALHTLRLTSLVNYAGTLPASQDGKNAGAFCHALDGVSPGVAPVGFEPRPTRQGTVMRALYGRDVWQGYLPSRPRRLEIQGWNGNHPLFQRLLQASPGKVCFVDVGAWKGQATVFVANFLHSRMRWTAVSLPSIPSWQATTGPPRASSSERWVGRPDIYETLVENVFYSGMSHLVVPLPETPLAAARILTGRGVGADVVSPRRIASL